MALSAKRSWLNANRDVAFRILRALAKANQMIHDQPAKARQVLKQRFAALPPDVYEAAWTANVAAYPATPRVEEVNVQRALVFLGAVQNQKIPGSAKDYFDNTYAEAAAKAVK